MPVILPAASKPNSKTCRIAAREDELDYEKGLITVPSGLHNFGTQWCRSVLIEIPRHRRDGRVGHLGDVGGGIERAFGATGLHLGEPSHQQTGQRCL